MNSALELGRDKTDQTGSQKSGTYIMVNAILVWGVCHLGLSPIPIFVTLLGIQEVPFIELRLCWPLVVQAQNYFVHHSMNIFSVFLIRLRRAIGDTAAP